MEKKERDDMELLLSGGTDKAAGKISPRLPLWQALAKGKRLAGLWGGGLNLANLRNDVLHAGFRKKPKSAEEIAEITGKVVCELREIAADWNLLEETSA
jgi:hypothetical protein